MAHFPKLSAAKQYAIMNGTDGKFLQYDTATDAVVVADYSNATPTPTTYNVFEVIISSNNPLTIELATGGGLFLTLDKPNDDVTFAPPLSSVDEKQEWIVSAGDSGIYGLVSLAC
jgi:hypothetical protein